MAKSSRSSDTSKSSRSRTTRGTGSRNRKNQPSNRKSGSHSASGGPSWAWSNLSSERKLDILGVILALIGLLTLLSLLSSQRGMVTQIWVDTLLQVTGWGAYLLPLGLIIIGLWLVVRNIDRIPDISPERMIGIFLIYLNFLCWAALLTQAVWPPTLDEVGGGYLGGFFEYLLLRGLGTAGTAIALLAWLLAGLAMVFDLSVPELLAAIQSFLKPMLKNNPQTATRKQPKPQPVEKSEEIDSEEPSELPPDFRPLMPVASAQTTASGGKAEGAVQTATGQKPAKASAGASRPGDTALTLWTLPSIDAILDPPTVVAQQASSDHDRARVIEETLRSFGAPAHVVEISRGPTVTQFGVEPDFIESRTGRMRVRVSKIVSLADDLSLALAAARIRIQAPVPGRNYVGIEVPNEEISRVTLREVMESDAFLKHHSLLRLALGKNVSGTGVAVELSNLPHLLIAGTTGSGKSVCVNSILCALLLNNSPIDLRLVLVDPKRVELTNYNGIPHLLAPVVVEAERVIGALQWMMREMDSRYHKFSQNGTRNILEFNTRFPNEHLPYLIVVIDELADLMMLAPDETERSITRLAQLARATGIHLILATQRPSVDVVTGLIKANFPARIAFAVASGVDSRVILDQPGAERLLGRGDMLFQAPDASAPVRLQGVFVSDSEIGRLVDYWRTEAGKVVTTPSATGPIETIPPGVPLHQAPLFEEMKTDGDPLLDEAIDLVRREGRASITMLQRRLRIGYTRAARLIDEMEDKKIVGPVVPNSQVREILDYGPTAPPAEN